MEGLIYSHVPREEIYFLMQQLALEYGLLPDSGSLKQNC